MNRAAFWVIVVPWQLALLGAFIYRSSREYYQTSYWQGSTFTTTWYGWPMLWWGTGQVTDRMIAPRGATPAGPLLVVHPPSYHFANLFILIAGLKIVWSLPIVVLGKMFEMERRNVLDSRLWRVSWYMLLSGFTAYLTSMVLAIYYGWLTFQKAKEMLGGPALPPPSMINFYHVNPQYWIVTLLGLIVGWVVAMWAVKKHTRVPIDPTDLTV